MYYIPKKDIFLQNKFLSQKQVIVTQNFPWKKQISFREKS